MSRPRLIPDPADTFEDAQRYRHGDLGEFSTQQLWAEETLVRNELARQIFFCIDITYGAHQADDDVRFERDWLAERQRRLAAERRKRAER